jgi:hypothetical protein
MSKSCSGASKLVLAVLALAACGREPTAAEKKAADDRAIAQVEAVQKIKPPPRPIAPQPILFADIQQYNLFGAGCAFAPGGSMGAVLLTRDKVAHMKLADRAVRFASDPGSARMPLETWSRYIGKDMALSLTRTQEPGAAPDQDAVRWQGKLTVTDAFDQVVYEADGLVQCGA